MKQICKASGTEFEITDEDLAFYQKVSPKIGGKIYEISPPTLCPEEREKRRWAYRNERKFYVRTSDFSGKQIVSLYAPDSPFKVYEDDVYWTDKWNPLEYGRDFDFSKSFFANFADLQRAVPRSALNQDIDNENSRYNSFCSHSKDCYLSAGFARCEDMHYSGWSLDITSAVDSLLCTDCELMYECMDCSNCYNLRFGQDSQNCSDSAFILDCIGCHHCLGCVNLRNKSYHVFNKPVSEEEFARIVEQLNSHDHLHAFEKQFEEFKISQVVRSSLQVNCEHSTGNHLKECHNCHNCYDSVGDAQDCKNCSVFGFQVRDMQDCLLATTNCELLYEVFAILELYQCAFIHYCNRSQNLYYCDNLASCKDCFGCIGLRHAQYCILNKQYSKEEYEELVPKIIEQMKQTPLNPPLTGGQNACEWGEFFPVELSPFAYNETVAQEYFPLTKEEVLAKGWKWRDEKVEIPQVSKVIPANRLPDSIDDIPDDILNWAIECEESGKPFKIQKAELEFYRKMRLSIPHYHPDIRHAHRMAKRNPRRLWERNCDNCQKPMETTYAPERTEKVFCEKCYQKVVY